MKYQLTATRLRDALDRAQLKAQDLADQSGVNKASISQYLNGSHIPSNLTAGKLAAVLCVDPVWLMGYDVPMLKSRGNPSSELDADEKDLLIMYRYIDCDAKHRIMSQLQVEYSQARKKEDAVSAS